VKRCSLVSFPIRLAAFQASGGADTYLLFSAFRIPNSAFKSLSSFLLSAFRIPNSAFKTLSSALCHLPSEIHSGLI
jgi:hypothetical protein